MTKIFGDGGNYYIIDLEAIDGGISLNYGKEGFQNPNSSDDVYIVNEKSHTVYYAKGIALNNQMHYYLNENGNITDNIPPSKPEIKVVSGTAAKDADGKIYYTTDVEIEIIPGKDNWSGIKGTQYSIDNGTTWNELDISNNIIEITKSGTYTILARSYDNVEKYAESTLTIEVSKFEIGSYVEYDVSYTDMYSGIEYTSTNGWRYLGTDDSGNKLLISTAIPVVLYYSSGIAGENAKWWDTDTTLNANVRSTNGMINNFAKIPYTQTASGTSVSTANIAIGRFAGTEITVDGTTYTAIGDTFKSSTYSSKIENVRTLTLAELNRAVNSANAGTDGYTDRAETSISSGFKDLTDEALGLFDMQDLTDYTASYDYWLASPYAGTPSLVCRVSYSISSVGSYFSSDHGVRPVVVLSSDVEFIKVDGIWKIAD